MAEAVDGRNYARNTIRALAHVNKPFIIRGNYYASGCKEIDYITYTDIRPYVPQGASTSQICNHLNVMRQDVEKYIAVRPDIEYQRDYLICRAHTYTDKKGVLRGGIRLTEELGVPPVLKANYEKTRSILEAIPAYRYIDFFSFAEGRYAYYGETKWEDGHKQTEEKKHKGKKKGKKSSAKGNPPMTADDFMELYDKLNPLWIPPPADLRHYDHVEFIKRYIPQKKLRDMLFGWPSLKREVMGRFARRM